MEDLEECGVASFTLPPSPVRSPTGSDNMSVWVEDADGEQRVYLGLHSPHSDASNHSDSMPPSLAGSDNSTATSTALIVPGDALDFPLVLWKSRDSPAELPRTSSALVPFQKLRLDTNLNQTTLPYKLSDSPLSGSSTSSPTAGLDGDSTGNSVQRTAEMQLASGFLGMDSCESTSMSQDFMNALRLGDLTQQEEPQLSVRLRGSRVELASVSEEEEADFLGPAENIKRLFKLPYSQSRVSLAVHRVGSTLVVDGELNENDLPAGFEDLPQDTLQLAQQSEEVTQCLLYEKFIYESMVSSQLPAPANNEISVPKEKEQLGQLHHRTTTKNHGKKSKKAKKAKQKTKNQDAATAGVPEPLSVDPTKQILGSQVLLFSNQEHPAVSLKLHDMDKELSLCTVLDYYLDNVIANIPELAICMHSKGLVRGYKLVETRQIPYMSGTGSPLFDVQDVKCIPRDTSTALPHNDDDTNDVKPIENEGDPTSENSDEDEDEDGEMGSFMDEELNRLQLKFSSACLELGQLYATSCKWTNAVNCIVEASRFLPLSSIPEGMQPFDLLSAEDDVIDALLDSLDFDGVGRGGFSRDKIITCISGAELRCSLLGLIGDMAAQKPMDVVGELIALYDIISGVKRELLPNLCDDSIEFMKTVGVADPSDGGTRGTRDEGLMVLSFFSYLRALSPPVDSELYFLLMKKLGNASNELGKYFLAVKHDYKEAFRWFERGCKIFNDIEANNMSSLNVAPSKARENEALKIFNKALSLYSELSDQKQVASTHYQVASFYSRMISSTLRSEKEIDDRGDKSTSTLTSRMEIARRHYEKALDYFGAVEVGKTFVLIHQELADLHILGGRLEGIEHALLILLNTYEAFNLASAKDSKFEKEALATLARDVVAKVKAVLHQLIRLSSGGRGPGSTNVHAKSKKLEMFKKMYKEVIYYDGYSAGSIVPILGTLRGMYTL
ncbi:hypothetical protein BBJ29_009754 [Phytophthora kernoviae]|uniref:EDRF1 N-terminal domain-containing protein n=1 Tax=Phytophthora kernoviae TaxID=325452 RepID=A0A3R7GC32_9STRA|nr:hypothetical protein BBJ29_009754 [Phytophthora kernoviae]